MINARRPETMSQLLKSPPVVTLAVRFWREDSGATAIEYAMIASGVAVAIATAVTALGSSVQGLFNNVASAMK
jgi:pilus assembly protein Flp/PilA